MAKSSSMKLPSFMNGNNGIYALVVVVVILGGLYYWFKYIGNKGTSNSKYGGKEGADSNMQMAYSSSRASSGGAPSPSDGLGNNEVFASVNGIGSPSQGVPTSCQKNNIQNPSELLPKDGNNQWSQLNPSGKGELANVNLLKAGALIGVDTIQGTLRNSNLQLRSEPPNPQGSVGPWNNSTITPDMMRPALELGQGPQ